MSMETLSPSEETQLLGAVKRAMAEAVDGADVNEAIEKVAREEAFGPGKIRLLCAAYNTGRQTNQRLNNTNVLDKLASFPLADAESIIDSIYNGPTPGEKQAAARVSDDYATPPTWLADAERSNELHQLKTAGIAMEKAAAEAAPKVEPVLSFARQQGMIEREKKAADESRRKASNCEDRVRGHVAELVSYFKKSAYDRLAFDLVEKCAVTYQGETIRPLLDVVYHGARLTEKRASDEMPIGPPVDWHKMPYSALRDCLKYARDMHTHKADNVQHLEKMAQLQEAVLRPFCQAAGNPPQPSLILVGSPRSSEKVAGIFGTPAGIAVGSLLGRALDDVPQRQKLVDDAVTDLDDPNHQNEIRKIRNMTMLTSMMSDPDDPISGHPPESVLREYNELSQMAPYTADQPAALRPLLRRRLEGHVEPFEAKELTDIEKGVSANKQPGVNLIPNAPKSILR